MFSFAEPFIKSSYMAEMTFIISFLFAEINSLSSKFSKISNGILFFIECEILIILECSLCLNILFNFTVEIALELIKSLRTLPGAIEGSWSLSPTSIILASLLMIFSKLYIKNTSIILDSSIITSSDLICFSLTNSSIFSSSVLQPIAL